MAKALVVTEAPWVRDGVFGAGALPDLVVVVDYARGLIGFRAPD